jgi:NADH:ubiquinone reductase (H+-translocating)
MNIVIVGGGFAGIKAALEISKRHLGKITLISDEPYFLHHATLYSTAVGRSLAESVIPLNQIFADHPNVTVVQDTMKNIETRRKLIIGKKKQYSYDKAVIAIGSVTTYFNINGMADHCFGVKSLEEIKKFNEHMHDEVAHKKLDNEYFIIGGGPTGIELAGALCEHLRSTIRINGIKNSKAQVTVVEAAPRILPRMSETASHIVSKRLRKMGVKVLTDHKVEALDDKHIVIDGKKVKTSTAIWTSGVANNPFFAQHPDTFHLAPNSRVIVDQYLQGAKDVFVIGDNNTVKYSGMAWPAFHQATFVAQHLSRVATKRPKVPFRPKSVMAGLPVGENWGYTEWHGVYIAGKLGAWVRRRMELYGYKQLAPPKLAKSAWQAHNVPEIDL